METYKKGVGIMSEITPTQNKKHSMTEEEAREVLKMISEGIELREIGRKFGVDAGQISRIKRNLRWKRIKR